MREKDRGAKVKMKERERQTSKRDIGPRETEEREKQTSESNR